MTGQMIKHAIFGCALVCLSGQPLVATTDQTPTFLILDASASMAEELGEGTRLKAAKEAVANVLNATLEETPDHDLGFVSFYDGCWVDVIARAEPLHTLHATLLLHVDDIETTKWGHTPIAKSLEIVSRLLGKAGGDIILVTDGVETCEKERDLCALAKSLKARHVALKINLVGLALSRKQKDALECIPHLTGGTFISADDPESLNSALGRAVQDAITDPDRNPGNDPRCHDNRGGLRYWWCGD